MPTLTIQLKPKNQPKRPGYYVCKRGSMYQPEIAEVRKENRKFIVLHGISIFTLSKGGFGDLWSDEINFRLS